MILIDDRAGSKELPPYIPARYKPTLCRLDFGDVAFSGKGPSGTCTIGIELKRIPDLVDCIYTGRYAGHQLPGMLDNYDHVYLITQGATRKSTRTGTLEYLRGRNWREPYGGQAQRTIGWYDYRAWLETMRVQGGVRIIESFSLQDTADHVIALYRWWQKPWDKHHSLHVFMEPRPAATLHRPSIKQQIAAQLPGIGWEKSSRVARHFPSVLDMLVASERDWQEIEGIGKVLAARVVRELQGQGRKG